MYNKVKSKCTYVVQYIKRYEVQNTKYREQYTRFKVDICSIIYHLCSTVL